MIHQDSRPPRAGHADLTAAEPRFPGLHQVTLQEISQPMSNVRLIRLKPEPNTETFKASYPVAPAPKPRLLLPCAKSAADVYRV